MILCGNPRSQYLAHKAEIDLALAGVLAKGNYILGEEVHALESEFASYIGVDYGIGVGSGTEALQVALQACGVGRGDEVVTVAHTAVATVSAIELCGAEPVLVDIEPDYYTLSPEKLESLLTDRTKAIIPVHLYGQPANLTPILEIARRRGIRVIEDCAQAHGAFFRGRRVGSLGDMACFSFYPTKNLGSAGDGGMVITSDRELARRARLVREYGWAERYVSHCPGFNSRLDELQAALLRVKLPFLDRENQTRNLIAQAYDRGLSGMPLGLPKKRPEASHVFHLYVVRAKQRDRLQESLKQAGVGALVHYAVPIHLQPAYRGRLRGSNELPVTEQAAREVLSLPIYPELSKEDVQQVIGTLRHSLEDLHD